MFQVTLRASRVRIEFQAEAFYLVRYLAKELHTARNNFFTNTIAGQYRDFVIIHV
jgi:hypothetical protein